MMTVGGFLANWMRRVSPPRMPTSSSLTILMTCWAGLSAPLTSALSARSLILSMKSRTTEHRDIGVEQGDPDLPRRRVDVGLGQPALATKVLERGLQAVLQGVEHGLVRILEMGGRASFQA